MLTTCNRYDSPGLGGFQGQAADIEIHAKETQNQLVDQRNHL